MLSDPFWTLAALAAGAGTYHTLIGPDHYIPFIAMSRAGCWTMRRTLVVSFLCGVGHVLASVLLGVVGAALLKEVEVLAGIEAFRGQLAAWLLVAFGLAYMIWGIRKAIRNQPHTHLHVHLDGTVHSHRHHHHGNHIHVHTEPGNTSMTPWILFTIFVFGPCEPLIPLLMYPALRHGWLAMALVAGIFATATIATMMTVIVLGRASLQRMRFGRLGRYMPALSGFALLACGSAMLWGM